MQINELLKDRRVQVAVATLVVAGGAGAGYILWKRRKESVSDAPTQLNLFDDTQDGYELYGDFQEALRADLESQAASSTVVDVNDPILEALLQEEAEIAEREAAKRTFADDHDDSIDKSGVVTIVPADHDDIWDYDAEIATRTREAPYVLHQDEYFTDEMGYHQTTVTYYVGDDIMADDHDKPMYGFHEIMGELLFGHGTADKDTVYIRNERLELEWEVIRHPGSYCYEVLGQQFEDADEHELRHSVHKFRPE